MCCKGEQVGYTNLKSPAQEALLNQLIGGASKGLQQGATKYPGQIAAGIDPLMKMAANIMSNYGSGKNYTGTPTTGMPPWYGGGGGTNPFSGGMPVIPGNTGGGIAPGPSGNGPGGNPNDPYSISPTTPNSTYPWWWQNNRPVNNPGWRPHEPI